LFEQNNQAVPQYFHHHVHDNGCDICWKVDRLEQSYINILLQAPTTTETISFISMDILEEVIMAPMLSDELTTLDFSEGDIIQISRNW